MPKYFGRTSKELEQVLNSIKKSSAESSTQSVREMEAAAAAKAAREAREFNSPGYSTMDVKESGAGNFPSESQFGGYYDEALDAAHIGDEIPASSIKQDVLSSEPYSKPTMDLGMDDVQPRAATREDFIEAPNKTGEVDTNFKGEIEKTPTVKSDPNAVSLDHFGDDTRIDRFDLGQRVSPQVDQLSTPVPGSKKLKEKSIAGLHEIAGPNSSKDLSLVEKLNKDLSEAKAKDLAEKQAHLESLHLDKEGGIGDIISGKKELTPQEKKAVFDNVLEQTADSGLSEETRKLIGYEASRDPKTFMTRFPKYKEYFKKALIFTVGVGAVGGLAALNTTGKDSQSKAPPPAPEVPTPDVEEVKSEEGTKEVASAGETPIDSPEQGNIDTILNSVNQEAKSGTNILELLKRAQDSRDSDMQNANILQGAGMIAAGFGRQDKNLMEPAAENMRKNSGIELKKLEENITIRDKDPNSAESKMWRTMIKDSFGKDIDPNVSADTLKKLFPELRNMQIAKARIENAKQVKNQQISDKESVLARRQLMTLKNSIIAGGGIAANQDRVRIGTADNIFNTIGVPTNVTPEEVDKLDSNMLNKNARLQVSELAIELNKLLSNSSVPAQKTLEKLIPNNIMMDTTKFRDYFTNKLNPAKQAEFIKTVAKIAARVKESSKERNDIMAQKYLAGTENIEKYHPDDYKQVLDELNLTHPTERAKQTRAKNKIISKEEAAEYKKAHGEQGLNHLIKEQGWKIGN